MKKSKIKRKILIKKIFCGVFVGIANSLFGGGGGMIAVPLLESCNLPTKKAHATAILVILPVSMISFLLYYIRGLFDYSVLIPTTLGVVLGGVLGAKFLGRFNQKVISIIFALLQIFSGIWMVFL